MTVGTQGNALGLGFFFRGLPPSVANKLVDGLFCGVPDHVVEVNDRGMLCTAMRTFLLRLVGCPVFALFPSVFVAARDVLGPVLFVPALGVFLLSGFSFLGVFKWH